MADVVVATGGHKTRAADILRVSRPRLDRLVGKCALGKLAPRRAGGPALPLDAGQPRWVPGSRFGYECSW